MRRAGGIVVALLIALLADATPAQTIPECLVTIHPDGSCDAAALHVPCREIGPSLRRAGIPASTLIRFRLDGKVSYDVVSATLQSVTRAGLTFRKIGSVNVEPAH